MMLLWWVVALLALGLFSQQIWRTRFMKILMCHKTANGYDLGIYESARLRNNRRVWVRAKLQKVHGAPSLGEAKNLALVLGLPLLVTPHKVWGNKKQVPFHIADMINLIF